jgi:hypothetical protein
MFAHIRVPQFYLHFWNPVYSNLRLVFVLHAIQIDTWYDCKSYLMMHWPRIQLGDGTTPFLYYPSQFGIVEH